MHIDHVSPQSGPEDVPYELLLKAGFPLTTKVESVETGGKQVFSIQDGALLICLEKEITPELVDALAEANPLQVICNALAHGNVVYLDENGHESPGHWLRYLAFLSTHEDGQSDRVAIFGEEDFLIFLKAWIAWVQTFPPEHEFAFAEAAE